MRCNWCRAISVCVSCLAIPFCRCPYHSILPLPTLLHPCPPLPPASPCLLSSPHIDSSPSQTNIESYTTDLIALTVAQRYSVLVTTCNDTEAKNWAIHANMECVLLLLSFLCNVALMICSLVRGAVLICLIRSLMVLYPTLLLPFHMACLRMKRFKGLTEQLRYAKLDSMNEERANTMSLTGIPRSQRNSPHPHHRRSPPPSLLQNNRSERLL